MFGVRGSYSAKIIKIVETILRLKEKEPEVKIVIFSQWDNILTVVEEALFQNQVSYTSNRRTRTFYECIEQFKVDDVVIILF